MSDLRTEDTGMLQRGWLENGVTNPEIEQIDVNTSSEEAMRTTADFGLSLMNSKGEKVSMEQYRGKVIFINFWATWCPPCVAEMPSINSMYKEDRKSVV